MLMEKKHANRESTMIVRKAVLTFVFLALACAALTVGPNVLAAAVPGADHAGSCEQDISGAPLQPARRDRGDT